jgi:hypothetical protein
MALAGPPHAMKMDPSPGAEANGIFTPGVFSETYFQERE